MRVSVVATGIDAVDVAKEVPVPRRSLAQPLKQVEEAPVAAAPAPAQQQRPVPVEAQAAPEPSLFEDMDAQRAAAAEQAEDLFEEEEAASFQPELPSFIADRGQQRAARAEAADDLPPPAYQPPAFEPQAMQEPEQAAYVAPKAPSLGTPSPEAMARLQAAVQRTPAQEQPAAQAPADDVERPRFGINSLINRMTGHGQEGAPAQAPRAQPSVQTSHAAPAPRPVAESDPEQERIEIPAFLRRQAN